MTGVVTGRCLCGEIRWETDGSQNWAGYCHCDICRRNCAAPVTAYFGVSDGHWRWTGEMPRTYTSSPGVTRHFCATCGTPMAYQSDRAPGEIHFYAASMDAAEEYRPEFHVFCAESLPWLRIADDLPRYPGGSTEEDTE